MNDIGEWIKLLGGLAGLAALAWRLVDEFGLNVVNAIGSITEQQRVVRNLIAKHIETVDASREIPDEQPA